MNYGKFYQMINKLNSLMENNTNEFHSNNKTGVNKNKIHKKYT